MGIVVTEESHDSKGHLHLTEIDPVQIKIYEVLCFVLPLCKQFYSVLFDNFTHR